MSMRALRWAIAGLIAVGAVAFVTVGANQPADPVLRPIESEAGADRAPFGDFGEVGFRIEGGGDRAVGIRCALLAETPAQQARGLMNRTDLGGYDGMLFRFASDTTAAFYMKNTPLPLSIAFFDAEGQFVSATDMTPCLGQEGCPTYAAAKAYRYALEVPEGALPAMGIGPGSRLVDTGPCP